MMYIKLIILFITSNILAVHCENFCTKNPSYIDGTIPVKSVLTRDTFFITLGIYGGDDKCGSYYQKVFYYPRYMKTTWMEAKLACKAYNMELASFNTLDEANAVIAMVERNTDLVSRDTIWIFIDGIALSPRSTTNWHWTDSGDKIDFDIPWLPGQPDTAGDVEFYLSIGRQSKSQHVGFNDVPGTNHVDIFLCQKYI